MGEIGRGSRLFKAKGYWGKGNLPDSAGRKKLRSKNCLAEANRSTKQQRACCFNYPPHLTRSQFCLVSGILTHICGGTTPICMKSHLLTLHLEQADWDRPCLNVFLGILNLTSPLTVLPQGAFSRGFLF